MLSSAWHLPITFLLLLIRKSSPVEDSASIAKKLPYMINIDTSSDHPLNLTILHHNPKPLRNRAPSRPLSTCPDPIPSLPSSTFLHSSCRRSRDALAFDISCHEIWAVNGQLADHDDDGGRDPAEDVRDSDVTLHPHEKTYELSCQDNEICVDGYGAVEGQDGSVAYCVETDNFRRIGAERTTHVEALLEDTDVVIAGGSSSSNERQNRLEVVLTKPDGRSAMYAKKMRVQAQAWSKMYNTEVWKTVKDGRVDCKECSQLEMRPIPVGVGMLHVDVILGAMDVDQGGYVYLFDVL